MSEKSLYQKIFDAMDLTIKAEVGMMMRFEEVVELRGYIKMLEEAYALERQAYIDQQTRGLE